MALENVELQATCAALGYQEGDTYHKEPDCLETVKDLIRFLKREDEGCDIRRELGAAQILQKDLAPLVQHYKDDTQLMEATLRLMVNLTQPAKLCFKNEIPGDKTNRKFFLEIESHLQSYKLVFCDESLFAVLTKKLGDLLQLDWENRQEEDRLLIERILILVRNILHVPPNPVNEQRTDDDASVHDQVLWALHTSGMEDLLLYLASAEDETQFAFHILEIVSLMFREQTPEQLSNAAGGRSLSEREQDEKELALIRETEKAQKKAAVMKYSTRHSRFGGTFTMAKLKSISDNDIIYHRPVATVKDVTFDHNKKRRKRPRNRQPLVQCAETRRSTLAIRVALRHFCVQFLHSCYNPLMKAVKDSLMRSTAQENDETYYMWAMRFFMEFNRRHGFRVDLVGETLSIPTFHYIQTNMQNFHEMMMSQKKEAIVWSRRMHLALKSYHELLQSLAAMDRAEDRQIRESSRVLKGNVFYTMEYRDIFVMLLRRFDETKQSRSFLKDLVEATHLFVKMLEQFSKQTGHLVVQRKRTKRRPRQNKHHLGNLGQKMPDREFSEEQLEDMWDDISSDLSAIFQGRAALPSDVTPFDAASGVELEEQRVNTMFRIQDWLRQKAPGEAVALLRAAREVWPDREEFGAAQISPEDEFMALREIFHADLPREGRPSCGVPGDAEGDEEAAPEDDGDHEEGDSLAVTEEREFDFREFVMRFAKPLVVKAYTIMLADFKKNSQHTNHCILKMLHRIGFQCELPGMLFQTSLFRIFQRILLDPASNTAYFKEMATFAANVVRKFFDVAMGNSKLYVEMFFWKSYKDSINVVEGYGTARARSMSVKQLWTEDADEELRQLYDRFREDTEDGMDVVDHILIHMTDNSKTRRQILRQLVHLDVIGSAKDLKRRTGSARPRGWGQEEELELRELFERFRHSGDPVGSIIPNMTHPRSKAKVMEKILEMGLVSEKKELYKKRGKGVGGKAKPGGHVEEWPEEAGERTDRHCDGDQDSRGKAAESDSDLTESEDEGDSAGSSSGDDEPDSTKVIRKAAGRASLRGRRWLRAALTWLRTSLQRCADDREEDADEEPIPLVPLTEELEDALEDKVFKALLKAIGLKSPVNQQERYWRIPGHIRPDVLRRRASLALPPDERRKRQGGECLKPEENVSQHTLTERDRPDASRTRGSQIADRDNENGDWESGADSDSDHHGPPDHPDPGETRPSFVQKTRLKRALISDSDDDSDNDRLVIEAVATGPEGRPGGARPAKKARVLSDGDDVREEVTGSADNESALHTFPATMHSVPLTDSDDSDLDDHVPLKKSRKKRPAIESDSE